MRDFKVAIRMNPYLVSTSKVDPASRGGHRMDGQVRIDRDWQIWKTFDPFEGNLQWPNMNNIIYTDSVRQPT